MCKRQQEAEEWIKIDPSTVSWRWSFLLNPEGICPAIDTCKNTITINIKEANWFRVGLKISTNLSCTRKFAEISPHFFEFNQNENNSSFFEQNVLKMIREAFAYFFHLLIRSSTRKKILAKLKAVYSVKFRVWYPCQFGLVIFRDLHSLLLSFIDDFSNEVNDDRWKMNQHQKVKLYKPVKQQWWIHKCSIECISDQSCLIDILWFVCLLKKFYEHKSKYCANYTLPVFFWSVSVVIARLQRKSFHWSIHWQSVIFLDSTKNTINEASTAYQRSFYKKVFGSF